MERIMTQETAKHTALPWEFDGNCAGKISQAGDYIAKAYSNRDASFIVHCVNNSHKIALVDELARVLDIFASQWVQKTGESAPDYVE
jgi:hypothetical protein